MLKDKLFFFGIYSLLWPFRWLPQAVLELIGKGLGTFAFYILPSYRKRALSNLSLAIDLNLSPQEIRRIAKRSFQNLVITCLEYSKFSYKKDLSSLIICENPSLAEELISQKQGIVFFCGHQANWEVLFLDGTQRMPGVAIGRPIKNPFLYRWITSIRERFGGMMITPKQAMREGFRALKQGKFLGIVGDQGMPESGFLSTFLGRRAWTSPAPAILAYRAKCPLMVATTVRKKGKYYIHYSDPLYPDLTLPLEEETAFLMQKALRLFEESVKKNPEQWLWQHNRWKQETPKTVYYKYRHDSLLILLPQDMTSLLPHLSVFREIYPSAFMTFMLPKNAPLLPLQDVEKIYYEKDSELFLQDLRYKLVFNLTPLKGLKHHFLKQSAFQVLALKDLYALAKKHPVSSEEPPLSDILKRALCRPNTLWTTGNASQ